MRHLEEIWAETCPPNEDPKKVEFYAKKAELDASINLLKEALKPLTKQELNYVNGITNTKPKSIVID